MIKLNPDIFVFDSIIPEEIIFKLLGIREKSGHTDRVDLGKADMNLLREFNNFWMQEIESPMMDEFFSVYDVENDIGFNVSYETIHNLKEWVKTKWRDIYLLNYNTKNHHRGEKDVHWDFSGLTFVGCLSGPYEGGLLCFPRQKISYKLNIGDLIVFPGGITHPHYVTPIISGQRNVIIGQSLNIKDNHEVEY